MRLVVIESPYAGDIERNLQYLRAAMRHSLELGEAPFASHGLYTQVWDDADPEQRQMGMEAGWAWFRVVDAAAVYTDLGTSRGMQGGIDRALEANVQVEFRTLRGTPYWPWPNEEAGPRKSDTHDGYTG